MILRIVRYLTFFIHDFHQGAVNLVFHFIGIAILIWGLARWNLLLMVMSFFIMEIGHLYNHLKGIERRGRNTILMQWFLIMIFLLNSRFIKVIIL